MYGKIQIACKLFVRTGMHIGGSDAFSAIGAADSPVIRDLFTNQPIVPGSSLKGKLRTLLVRSSSGDIQHMPDFSNDPEPILRLFGSAKPVRAARLQFADCFLAKDNATGETGVTEIKFENTISRANSVANPRQIERVTAGTKFDVRIVYDAVDPAQIEGDLALLAKGMKLLQLDYLGGHGTRGSGRVSLVDFTLTPFDLDVDINHLSSLFQEVADYELLPV